VIEPELRRQVAAGHGLPTGSEKFLAGESIAELEASAAALAQLVTRADPQEPDPLSAALQAGGADKARRQRELLQVLHGTAQQPRDERGRFAGGFDGGARTPVPMKGPPELEHDAWIVDRVVDARAHRGTGW
jgi:hypothetical protein